MFKLEQSFSSESPNMLVVRQAAKQSVEDFQRDVFDSHRHRVFAIAYYMTGNEVEAEQVLGQTFIKVFQASEKPDARQVDESLVQQLGSRFPLQQEEPAAVPSPQSNLSQHNVRRTDLEEAIQFLPANERLIFLLRDVEGYSAEAIAKLIEVPEAKVQRAIFSARIRLRQILADAKNNQDAAA